MDSTELPRVPDRSISASSTVPFFELHYYGSALSSSSAAAVSRRLRQRPPSACVCPQSLHIFGALKLLLIQQRYIYVVFALVPSLIQHIVMLFKETCRIFEH